MSQVGQHQIRHWYFSSVPVLKNKTNNHVYLICCPLVASIKQIFTNIYYSTSIQPQQYFLEGTILLELIFFKFFLEILSWKCKEWLEKRRYTVSNGYHITCGQWKLGGRNRKTVLPPWFMHGGRNSVLPVCPCWMVFSSIVLSLWSKLYH